MPSESLWSDAADRDAAPDFSFLPAPGGGFMRTARWPAPAGAAVGTLVLLQGLGEFLERYQDLALRYRAQGWQVFGLDWRGQGRSDRFLPHLRGGGHVPDFDLLRADLLRFLEVRVLPERRGPTLALLAHSMGGLIALKALLAGAARRVDAAVLSAPLLGLRTDPFPRPVARHLAAALCRLGFAGWFAFGQRPYDPAWHARFEGNVMTADAARFALVHTYFRDHPEAAVGGVTFGWVAAAFRAIDQVLSDPGLARLAVPTLILSAPSDRLIDPAPHKALAQRLPRAALRLYPESRHEPLMEVPAVRDRVLADVDAFLTGVRLGVDPPLP